MTTSNAKPPLNYSRPIYVERVKAVIDNMPFDVEEYLEFDIPGSDAVGDWGD